MVRMMRAILVLAGLATVSILAGCGPNADARATMANPACKTASPMTGI